MSLKLQSILVPRSLCATAFEAYTEVVRMGGALHDMIVRERYFEFPQADIRDGAYYEMSEMSSGIILRYADSQ